MRLFLVLGLLALSNTPVHAQRGYQTFDFPPAVSNGTDTFLTGIRGPNIVGVWREADGTTHGLYFDGTTWQAPPNEYLDFPGASSTALYGPSLGNLDTGVIIVGSYKDTNSGPDHGCFFDSSQPTELQWTNIDVPGSTNTIAHSTFGDRIVGNYDIISGNGYDKTAVGGHAFVYQISTEEFTTLKFPGRGVISTTAYGIYEDTVAGGYTDLKGTHGYIHKLGTNQWQSFDHPGGAIVTHFDGITANATGGFNLTGDWLSLKDLAGGTPKAFFLSLQGSKQIWAKVQVPGSTVTSGNSVFQSTVIGVYSDDDGIIHGFIRTYVPGPFSPWGIDLVAQIEQLPGRIADLLFKRK